MSTLEELWAELDKSAIQLLRDAMGGGGALPAEGGEVTLPPVGGSLNEKTRVFSAISAYAKSRQEVGPSTGQPEKSEYDELRERFNRVGAGAPQRGSPKRGARAGAKAPEGDGTGPDLRIV